MATREITSGYPLGYGRSFWSGVFAGTFVFLAIEATFGMLGAAIFADAASPVGFTIWMVILSIIALYFAGRTSAHLSNADTRNTGLYQGLVTFGMSAFATVLSLGIVLSSTVAGTATAAGTLNRWDIVSVAGKGGWGIFLALFLGMLAAMIGSTHAIAKPAASVAPITRASEERRVA
jgi:hypothetical protein